MGGTGHTSLNLSLFDISGYEIVGGINGKLL